MLATLVFTADAIPTAIRLAVYVTSASLVHTEISVLSGAFCKVVASERHVNDQCEDGDKVKS